jgi:hypothetical protein
MKKIFILLLWLLLAGHHVISQCVPDLNITQPGIYPDSATGLAPGVVGQPYQQVMQIKVLTDTSIVYLGFQVNVTIQNIQLMSFTGFPPGITYACNPATCIFPGGSNACVLISGVPTTAGVYNLNAVVRTTGTTVLFGQTITLTQFDTIDYYSIVVGVAGLYEINPLMFNLGIPWPNPAVDYTVVDFYVPSDARLSYGIYTLTGQQVRAGTLRARKGFNIHKISLQGLTPGVYLYSLSTHSLRLTRKLVVQPK